MPAGLLPEVFASATITDPDIEVCVDHHLMLWARVRNWDDYRPIVDGRCLGITYEETFQEPLATVVVSQLELAETFLDQKDEGQAVAYIEEYEDMEDESGGIRAQEAPSIKTKKDTRKQSQRQASASPGRTGGGTRAAYLMPSCRYPIAVPGALFRYYQCEKSSPIWCSILNSSRYGKGYKRSLCNLWHSSKCYCPDSNEPRTICQSQFPWYQ